MTTDISEFQNIAQLEELRAINADLQKRLRKAKAATETLVEATIEGAKAAMVSLGPIPAVEAPKADARRVKPEVALWHLTDFQGSKVTSTFNSEILRKRILHFCATAEKITTMQRADHPVRDCTIMFGGDMIEGLFQYPSQPFEIDATLFDQFVKAARLCVDVVRSALAFYENVTVVSEWGNHGRIGNKRASVPQSDSFDRMVYHLAREILADEKRLTWEDCPEDIQRVEIGNYRALLIHGDEVGRNGYASPGRLIQHVAKWQSGAYPWDFSSCYSGHIHTHQEWALPSGKGSVYVTGAPESDNRYARDTMAASSRPSQRLHFVEPSRGHVTGQFQIWLDNA